ncbi:hypothetical protein A2U01_0094249, partial [Trifolium medium]|nr:hypothetical protein [Trifolium medium]
IKEANDLVQSAGNINTLRPKVHRGDVDNTAQAGTKAKQEVVIEAAPVKEGDGFPGVVHVGDIVVSLGARQEKGARTSGP